MRRALGGYGFLLAWTLLILTIIRVYTGAFWSGDWLEHFQRTLFFLHHFPNATPIYGDYRSAGASTDDEHAGRRSSWA